MAELFIQVILPLKLDWEPWYSVRTPLPVGRRIVVKFSGKDYVGVVHRCCSNADAGLSHIFPAGPECAGMADISENELKLWEFISSYYLCSIGEVYKAAYPAIKRKGEDVVMNSLAQLKRRIAALDAELEARAASKRVSPEITQRMKARRDELAAQAEALISRKDAEPRKSVRHPGKPVLLTGSDRIDEYAGKIKATGSDVLVLVPDFIAGDMLAKELEVRLGDVCRFDSRVSSAGRREISERLRAGNVRTVLVSTRSGIFLPFSNLGLVIIDEEQDEFYKQDDPAPRYNGRDCAIKLAQLHGAEVILGSSTPSLDSIYNCMCGKFTGRECRKELSGSVRAAEVIDITAEARKNGMKGIFSRKLIDEINSFDGPVTLVRGWEKEDELAAQAKDLLTRDTDVLRYREAREKPLDNHLVAILQADALVRKDDFRADEKASRIVAGLSSRCARLVIQTSVPERFSSGRSSYELMEERRQFGFPPFKRMVEIRKKGERTPISTVFLDKDASLQQEKTRIKDSFHGCIIDVDPQ